MASVEKTEKRPPTVPRVEEKHDKDKDRPSKLLGPAKLVARDDIKNDSIRWAKDLDAVLYEETYRTGAAKSVEMNVYNARYLEAVKRRLHARGLTLRKKTQHRENRMLVWITRIGVRREARR